MSQEATIQSRRIFEYFRGADSRAHYEDLVHYAEWQVRRTSWSCGSNDPRLSNGQSGEDVLHEVVLDTTTIDGSGNCRRRIPAEIPLEVALRKIVLSKISHTFEASESKLRKDSVTVMPDGENLDAIETDQPFWPPEGDRLSAAAEAQARDRSEKFIEFVRSDRVVHGMLVLLRDEDLDKPAETVAARLGVVVSEIYIARKRLATLVKKFQEREGGKR